MTDIVRSMTDVSAVVARISEAGNAQAVRMATVSDAIGAMDKSLQHNADMVKKTAKRPVACRNVRTAGAGGERVPS